MIPETAMDASMMATMDQMSQSQIGKMTNSPSGSGFKNRLLNAFGLQSGTQ